jgi:putative lipoprotein
MRRLLPAFVVLLGLVAQAVAADKDKDKDKDEKKPVLTGKVECKDKAEFTPDTVCEIQIQDVSIADTPAKVIAKVTIKDLKDFPIPFEIEYDPALIKPNAEIALSVRISTKGKLDYVNDTRIAVITRNKPAKDVAAPVIKVKK